MRQTVDRVGISPSGKQNSPLAEIDPEVQLNKQSFEELLGKIDSGLRALPATAQVLGFLCKALCAESLVV